MSDFLPAIEVILAHEGGYVWKKNDPGGPTNFGISLRFILKEWPACAAAGCALSFPPPKTVNGIRMMTRAQAIEIYRACFWDLNGYGRITDQTAATKVADLAVNMGPPYRGRPKIGQAHVLAQEAANACGAALTVDGAFGPATVAGINALRPADFVAALTAGATRFYRDLVTARPDKVDFLSGWLARAAWGSTTEWEVT